MYTTYSPFMFSRTSKSLRALRIDLTHSSKKSGKQSFDQTLAMNCQEDAA
jgi:hypothetical protein